MKNWIINQLERIWSENKAKGILSQVKFVEDLKKETLGKNIKKYYNGCWIFAPKTPDYFKHRFLFFIHPKIKAQPFDKNEIEPAEIMKEADAIKFKRIAGFLNNAGMGVVYSIPLGENIKNISWQLFRFDFNRESLISLDADDFFRNWGNRGRPSHSRGWTEDTKKQYQMLEDDVLISLFLNEHFYTEYLKREKHIPVSDPYDVDGFFIIYSSGRVIPIEIKEKFPAGVNDDRFFGIDAGRVLMLLRICLPNDANALYIIREVDDSSERNFLGWKYITLSDIIMSSGWNLQRGGRGMGGQETQTIRLPYYQFKNLDGSVLRDISLDKIGKLPDEIKKAVKDFISERKNFFGW
ncbi:MAG: hypothetical protein H0Z16_03205 [Thermodesulfobacterium sp.]|nr:hypothetical protein [Thermodesulfobacterium sp.]